MLKVGDHCLSTLFFVDDQVLIANGEEDIDYMLRKLQEEYNLAGMKMDMAKTEYLRIGKEGKDLDLWLRLVNQFEEYKYLGSIRSNKGSSVQEIQRKIQQGQRSTIYGAIVEPIMTYESESWQQKEPMRRKIDAVEMDFLRRLCRISRLEHIPNDEIRRRTHRRHRTTERIETRQLAC
ncbi:uncharacterized protein LOC132697110 [Cylas formicarius]|uniref:uncharacterized protein LOC132697110 n=1 Tax=Cylas formicarius TaxID=197179 RepID=UPI002958405E|nr:uncharacterized protein LOC132697110 [Cylas formicarius]